MRMPSHNTIDTFLAGYPPDVRVLINAAQKAWKARMNV